MTHALDTQDRRLVGPAEGAGSPSRRGLGLDRILLVLAAGGWAVAVAWLALGAGDADAQVAVADVGQTVLDLLAAAIVLRAAMRADVRRVRIGWTLIGVAMLLFAAGDGIWIWMDVITGDVASVSLADLMYLAYYPIVVAALLIFQSASAVRRETLRLGIDSLIVLIGGGIVVWHTLFRPALGSLDPDPVVAALALGYPICDLVLLFGVAATALRRPANVDARALTALVAGLGLMFVGDVGYGQLNLLGSSDTQRWPDAVYMTSTLLIEIGRAHV